MRIAVALVLVPAFARTLLAQDEFGRMPPPPTGVPLLDEARRAQWNFEAYRRENLPDFRGKGAMGSNTPDTERIGKFIYWYDESEPPPPPEPQVIGAERARLIALLDSAARAYPGDDWTVGQLVRYLVEHGQSGDAIAASLRCGAEPWWCAALAGFSYHDARQFVRADSAFQASLRQMSDRLRCDWSNAYMLLDEFTVRTYNRFACGTAERERYEARMWWLAKPLYSRDGLDTRTEFLARMTMVRMLEQAPSAHQFGFDIDERELLLRYGWPRAWSVSGRRPPPPGQIRGGMPARGGDMGGQATPMSIISHEPSPSYQFLPPASLFNSPALSDSVDWETGVPPVKARYAPSYARRIYALKHQSALFRRGDSSAVVLAWDATETPIGGGENLSLALVLARADSLTTTITTRTRAPLKGTMIARGPWKQLLMSAEMTAAGVDTVIRARYGLRPPFAIGARVTLSEMLFFADHEQLPNTLEEAAAHALPSIRLRNDQRLGVYFESYGTNPLGEKLKVTFTVAREEEEPGFVRRRLQALRLSREATPVRLTVEDQSARNAAYTPRAAYLDIRQLRRGSYIVQLEVEVAGQYVVRTERALEIVN